MKYFICVTVAIFAFHYSVNKLVYCFNYCRIKANNKSRRYGNKQNGFRLGYRKTLQERRRRISDYSLCSAVFGIITMILMTEFQWAGVIQQVYMIIEILFY